MDATVVSDAVSFVGMLGATVDFNDVDVLDFLGTALIVGANAEVLPATTAKIATTLTEMLQNFILFFCNLIGAIMQLLFFFDFAQVMSA